MTHIYRIMQLMVSACLLVLYLLHVVVGVPTHYIGKLNHWLMLHPYYWAIVRRRRLLGEDEWHERDLQRLGITPPEGHPYWKHLRPCGCLRSVTHEHEHEVLL